MKNNDKTKNKERQKGETGSKSKKKKKINSKADVDENIKSTEKKLNNKKEDLAPTIVRWIQLLKALKLKQLKINIDGEINNYEVSKNINDQLLLFLNEELEEKEIFERIKEMKNNNANFLFNLHKKNMNNLQLKFEKEILKMYKYYEQDEAILTKNKNQLLHDIHVFYDQMEEEKKKRKKTLEKEQSDIMDDIYKNYLSEEYITDYHVEKFKQEDKKNFIEVLLENEKALDKENENYNTIKLKFERNKRILHSKEKEV